MKTIKIKNIKDIDKFQKALQELHEIMVEENQFHIIIIKFGPELMVECAGNESWIGQTLLDMSDTLQHKIISKSPDLIQVKKN